jgi:hypothetical protein
MTDPTPDWYPDPTGRHELRYWDGSHWTEHVVEGGIPTTDAAGARSTAADVARGHTPRMLRLWGATPALAVFAAAMWFAWLGWDHEYYLVDGVAQGPYRAWQVIGSGLAVATAAVLAYLWVRRSAAIFVLAAAAVIGFAVPWSVDASASDETGLWVAGLLFLLVGGGVGLVVVLSLTEALARTRRPKTA